VPGPATAPPDGCLRWLSAAASPHIAMRLLGRRRADQLEPPDWVSEWRSSQKARLGMTGNALARHSPAMVPAENSAPR
jgi:hypothetical protein